MRQERHAGLDLVRGIGALAVANHHFWNWNYGVHSGSLGISAVFLFFALSALTLMMIYGPRFGEAVNAHQLASFYKARLARIMPLLIAMSLVFAAVSTLTRGFDPHYLLRSILTGTGLMALHMPGYDATVTGSWSLGIELAFYAIFPMVALLGMHCKVRTLTYAVAFLFAGQAVLVATLSSFAGEAEHWFSFASPLAFAPYFALGMLAYRLPRRQVTWQITLCLYAIIIAYNWVFPADLLRNPASLAIFGCLVGATLIAGYWTICPAWMIAPAAFFADISYALYLTHRVSDTAAAAITERLGLPAGAHFIMFALVAVGVSYAVYRWFELPARDLLLKGRSLRQTHPDPSRIDRGTGVPDLRPALEAKVAGGMGHDGERPAVR